MVRINRATEPKTLQGLWARQGSDDSYLVAGDALRGFLADSDKGYF